MHKKVYKILPLLPLGIIFVGTGILIGYLVSFSSLGKKIIKQPENEIDDKDIKDELTIFPEFNRYDFYDDLKVINEKVVIDEEMIAKIINFVINKIQVPHGDLKYNYNLLNFQTLIVTFQWEINTKIFKHSYLIKVV